MPRREHDTGVMVMTPLELFAKIDEAEGLEPGTSMAGLLAELDQAALTDSQRQLAEWRTDPSSLLGHILSWCDPEYPDNPLEILEVAEVEYNYTLRGYHLIVTGRYRLAESGARFFHFRESHESGVGHYDPPDDDFNLEDGPCPIPLHSIGPS